LRVHPRHAHFDTRRQLPHQPVQRPQPGRIHHRPGAWLDDTQHVSGIAADRSRRAVGQIDHQQQHAVPPLERPRRQKPTEQRVRLGHYPHLTRQDSTQLLQSVAFTPGTGKSHVLIGLGIAPVHAGHKVRYLTAIDLVETLYRGLADNTVGKIIDTLLRAELIIIDEIGFAPLDDTGTQLLFRLVAAAYERRSLAVASHWPFEQWGRFLPEHTTAVSILDRLLHHASIVVTDGDSFRMRQSQLNQGGARR
jgi:hypothetical protein